MAIEKIDTNLCNGCGICVDSCGVDVIHMDKKKKKAIIVYPDDCVVCNSCQNDCPQHAITVSPIINTTPLTLWGIGV
jgi:NAD-dependent dihydropyrimidine dehydrogenase PreA subunit